MKTTTGGIARIARASARTAAVTAKNAEKAMDHAPTTEAEYLREIERDPWAHVEPSHFTARPHFESFRNGYGDPRWVVNGTMYEHPTVNGGTHCVWEWPDGEAIEFWRDTMRRVIAGPRVTQREKAR
ncbi:hypothetical protein ACVBR5_000910 [Burkholderia cenocepacia]